MGGALVGLLLGVASRSYLAAGLGLMAALDFLVYFFQVSRPERQVSPAYTSAAGEKRPGMVSSQPPRLQQNLEFATLPGGERKLLCDLWQPAEGAPVSGLAFIYFHGSAWYLLDKDFGTRTFFRRLTSQGHLVMDVAYRLFPEAGVFDMVQDVKRAIAWLKDHAGEYGVDPGRIVIGGGSAGGHIALLAAFAPDHPRMTPPELASHDLSVCAVVSLYGPTDLAACYEHTGQSRLGGEMPDIAQLTPAELRQNAGRLDWLMGGRLQDIPDEYAMASPNHHVHPGCPPVLLIQGDQDWVTPVKATRELYQKLCEAGVAAINLVFPHTNHGFDLFFPRISPAAQIALDEIDRFLLVLG
jgi:acetyl esterase/lipase